MIKAAGDKKFGATEADTFWLLICGFLVFFMQCGFALLEAGTVRAKNAKNILLKNLLDACVGAIIWWSVGFMIAYDSGHGFIGASATSGAAPSFFLNGPLGMQPGLQSVVAAARADRSQTHPHQRRSRRAI